MSKQKINSSKFVKSPWFIAGSVLMFSLVGVVFLAYSRAATSSIAIETENFNISSPATTVFDSGASGNSYVLFRDVNSVPNEGPQGEKPTTANTGPTTSEANLTPMNGGKLSGTYTGVKISGSVDPSGPLTLKDCVINGGLRQIIARAPEIVGPLNIENCIIRGWVGIGDVGHSNPNTTMVNFKNVYINPAPSDGDPVQIGSATTWGNNSSYTNLVWDNVLIEHEFVMEGPYPNGIPHYDMIQFSGGKNAYFKNVRLHYLTNAQLAGGTQFINNGVRHQNVVFENLWVEGGPLGYYAVSGNTTFRNCLIERGSYSGGFVYPGDPITLENCFTDQGAEITN